MRNLIGPVFFLVAAWLALAAFRHKRRASAASLPAPAVAGSGRLDGLATVMPPVIIAALTLVGLKTTLMFVAIGSNRLFSVLDLAGFLAVLAAYGAWLLVKTRYRAGAAAAVPAFQEAPVDGLERADLPRDPLGAGAGDGLGIPGAVAPAPGPRAGSREGSGWRTAA